MTLPLTPVTVTHMTTTEITTPLGTMSSDIRVDANLHIGDTIIVHTFFSSTIYTVTRETFDAHDGRGGAIVGTTDAGTERWFVAV